MAEQSAALRSTASPPRAKRPKLEAASGKEAKAKPTLVTYDVSRSVYFDNADAPMAPDLVVTLRTNYAERTVRLHRFNVLTQSTFFERMLSDQATMGEAVRQRDQPIVPIEVHVDSIPSTFTILHMLYMSHTEITSILEDNDLSGLLRAASYLQCHALQTVLETSIVKKMANEQPDFSITNTMRALAVGRALGVDSIVTACRKYIRRQFVSILVTCNSRGDKYQTLVEYLERDDLRAIIAPAHEYDNSRRYNRYRQFMDAKTPEPAITIELHMLRFLREWYEHHKDRRICLWLLAVNEPNNIYLDALLASEPPIAQEAISLVHQIFGLDAHMFILRRLVKAQEAAYAYSQMLTRVVMRKPGGEDDDMYRSFAFGLPDSQTFSEQVASMGKILGTRPRVSTEEETLSATPSYHLAYGISPRILGMSNDIGYNLDVAEPYPTFAEWCVSPVGRDTSDDIDDIDDIVDATE